MPGARSFYLRCIQLHVHSNKVSGFIIDSIANTKVVLLLQCRSLHYQPRLKQITVLDIIKRELRRQVSRVTDGTTA